MSETVRLFAAVDPPERIREAIGRFLEPAARLAGVRWVGRERMHFTLAFLGSVEAAHVPAIGAALDAAVGGPPPFTLALRGAGAFPSAARPRVIWIGAGQGGEDLAALAGLVRRGLAPLGFAADRPFAAHLTIGRVKERLRDPGPLRRLLGEARDRGFGEFLVPAVRLCRSDLFPSGPRYTILHETRLAGETRGAASQGSGQ